MLDNELIHIMGFPDGSNGRESACNARDLGLILGSGRSPGEGTGYPLQYSCQENSMDRKAIVFLWSHKELDTTERLTLSLSMGRWWIHRTKK